MYSQNALKAFSKAEKLVAKNQDAKAIIEYKKAIKFDGAFYEAFNNLGNALFRMRRFKEAVDAFQNALKINPNLISTQSNLGNALSESGNYEQALKAYNKAISLNPNVASPYYERAVSLYKQQAFSDSLDDINYAIKLEPKNLSFIILKTKLLFTLEREPEALKLSESFISTNPNSSSIFHHANLLSKVNDFNSANAHYQEVIQLNPNFPEAYYNLATNQKKQGLLGESAKNFRLAIQLKPDYLEAHNNLANVYLELGRTDDSIQCFNKALLLDSNNPTANHGLSSAYLNKGNFEKAWPYYAYRDRTHVNPINLKPIPNKKQWNGTLKTGDSLLIHAEQGIGDEIFFSRFLVPLNTLASSQETQIHVTCDKRLLTLFQRSFPAITFQDKKIPTEDIFKYEVHIASLAQYFVKTIDDCHRYNKPFLKVDTSKTSKFRSELNSDRNTICGVSWVSAGNTALAHATRSIPLVNFTKILRSNEIMPLDLQYGDHEKEIAEFSDQTGIMIHQVSDVDNLNDIDDLFSLIAACDFVITTANSTTHFSGSIGVKNYQLTPRGAGDTWYWNQLDSDDTSLWYPSVHILRQTIAGNWEMPLISLRNFLS